jgi:putative ABC transport system permease protein
MLTMKRAFKNIWRRRFRTALVGIVLALCVAVFASTIASVDASEATTAAMLENYESAAQSTIEQTELSMTAITVRSSFGRMFSTGDQSGMSEDIVDDILAMDSVAAVVPTVEGGFGAAENTGGGQGGGAPFGMRPAYTVVGVPLESISEEYGILPISIIEGRSLNEGENDTVIICEQLTEYFGAGVDEGTEIDDKYFKIVGIFTSTFRQNEVYTSLESAQELLDMEGELSSLTVYAEDADSVDDVVAQIEEEYPDYMVMAMSDMQSQFGDRIVNQQQSIIGSTDDNLSSIQSLGLQITIVSAIVGVLLIFGLMFYTVRERTKEIGTLKAIGFSNGEVMKQFMYEGMYVGLIGGIIGLALAAAAASGLSSWLIDPSETLGQSVSVHITAMAIILGLVVAVLAGTLGSLYPAWRASRVSPMESLRRE